MSKIDEIMEKPELQNRVSWLYYANDDGYAGYGDIIGYLEQLRPLVEYAESSLELKELQMKAGDIMLSHRKMTQEEHENLVLRQPDLIQKIKQCERQIQEQSHETK